MATLDLALKARTLGVSNPVKQLYRSMSKELPRVLTLYDIDIPVPEARRAVQNHFRKNGNVRDDRVVTMLVEKGYMELEETLLQWKQRSHLVRVFEGYVQPTGARRKRLTPDATVDEQFARA